MSPSTLAALMSGGPIMMGMARDDKPEPTASSECAFQIFEKLVEIRSNGVTMTPAEQQLYDKCLSHVSGYFDHLLAEDSKAPMEPKDADDEDEDEDDLDDKD